ncbi:MAG: hypothetical protein ACREM2_03065, partial [Vulcanimicrobiaceae bacterium]
FYNGYYDMFEQEPFPFRFNIFEAIGTYSINPELSLQEGWANLWQQNQNVPLPGNVHYVQFFTNLNLHLDFNKLL